MVMSQCLEESCFYLSWSFVHKALSWLHVAGAHGALRGGHCGTTNASEHASSLGFSAAEGRWQCFALPDVFGWCLRRWFLHQTSLFCLPNSFWFHRVVGCVVQRVTNVTAKCTTPLKVP